MTAIDRASPCTFNASTSEARKFSIANGLSAGTVVTVLGPERMEALDMLPSGAAPGASVPHQCQDAGLFYAEGYMVGIRSPLVKNQKGLHRRKPLVCLVAGTGVEPVTFG